MEPLKGALIGYGNACTQSHAPFFLGNEEEAQIVAVADVSEGRRGIVAHQLPGARVYTAADILIESEELDFVCISTPSALHTDIAGLALDRKMHVLCESPLATDSRQAVELLARAERNKRVVFPCHRYKWTEPAKSIFETIEAGTLGKITGLNVHLCQSGHPKGAPEWNPDWRREHRYGDGGVGMDWGTRVLSLALDWFGEVPSSISAKRGQTEGNNSDTEDNLVIVVGFPAGVATLQVSWAAAGPRGVFLVDGTKGGLTVAEPHWERLGGTEHRTLQTDPLGTGGFAECWSRFNQAIRKDQWAGPEARNAVLSTQLVHQAYRSLQEGGRELPFSQ